MFYNRIPHHSWARFGALLVAALAFACVANLAAAQSAAAATYYISPNGNDNSNGTSTGTAWKTFDRAWDTLQPGDTLLVMDGTYTEVIRPTISGEPGQPITVKAQNDGAVTIDAQGKDAAVGLADKHENHGNWFVIEGIVARNGDDTVFKVIGDHNVLRRISAYDASPDTNSLVILLWGDNNLVEDAVAAGTGRYMYDVYQGSGNTLRRVFSMWEGWDGRRFCGVTWPNGNNIGVYNASNTTVENAIAYGRSLTGIFIQANDDAATAENNQILGSMALLQGRDYDGSRWQYGAGMDQPTSRPGPTVNPSTPGANCDQAVTKWEWGNLRSGFSIWGQGTVRNNVFRDILATGNMGTGFNAAQPYANGDKSNNIVDHATLWSNGADIPPWEAEGGGNISLRMDGVNEPTNSRIANSKWADQGEGARLQYRYVDRQLTAQALWPWPMEDRIRRELGVSVNEIGAKYANIDGFGVTVTPATRELKKNGTAEVTVKIDAFGKFAKPVTLHASEAGSGLRLEPADATVNAPGQWTFKVTAPNASGVYEINITAKAEGMSEVQRKVTILVDPQLLFLPAISSGKR